MADLLLLQMDHRYLAQITEIGAQISDFVSKNGVLAFLIVIIALVVLIIFAGLIYALTLIAKVLLKQQDSSAKRDERIETVSSKVDDVAKSQDKVEDLLEKSATAYDKMTASMDANTEVTRATVTSYQALDENVVKSYDATSAVIGITSADVKKNSDQNADKIITVIQDFQKSIESEDGALRTDLKTHSDRIIGQFQALYKRNVELEAENILLKMTSAARLQDKNAGVTTDSNPTEPLVVMEAAKLSPIDGEANREIIDAAKVDHPTGEAK